MKRSVRSGRVVGFLGALSVLVLVTVLIHLAVAAFERRAAIDRIQHLDTGVVDLIGRSLRTRIQAARGDVAMLAQVPALRAYVDAMDGTEDAPARRKAVQALLESVARTRPDYAQVRVLDGAGRERIRVDRDADGIHVVNEAHLQDKSARPYARAIARLAPGALYVSPLDLNIEHGRVVRPLEPTLRLGTPLPGTRGGRAMLVINLDGRGLLAMFRDDARLAHGSVWLTDGEGRWLRGPDPSRDWRFLDAGHEDAGLAHDRPAVWAAIRGAANGSVRGPFGVLAHDTVDLGDGADGPRLRVLALAQPPTLADILLDRVHVLLFVLSLPLLALLAVWIGYLRASLTGAQQRMRANARLLDDIFAHSRLSMKVKDIDGRLVRVNQAAEAMLGRPREALIGRTIDEVATAESSALIRAHDREVLERGVSTDYEEQVDYLGGSRHLLTTRFPVTDHRGRVTGVGAVSVDITERIRMEESLRLAKVEAESANQAKSAFLANMSHELRTPLNSIIGLSELVMEQAGESDDAESVEVMRRVVQAGRHLLVLINDILDISRIEAGHLELHLEPTRVDDLVQSMVRTMQPLARASGNRLQMRVRSNPGSAWIDPVRMRQVLLNIIGNAVKFTRDGQVEVTLDRAGDDVLVAVADSGIGMSAEQVQRVFEPFEQADRSIARRFGGTGLGLSICRQLLGMMGGQIDVESELHHGSVFTLRIPIGDLHEDEPVPVAAPAAAPADARSPVVLVVDDDEDARALLRAVLEREGLQVIEADSGRSALEKTRAYCPAVMVLDILLGDMSGWDVLGALRADPRHAELPVILCTVTDPDRRTAVLGVIEHLTKPFDRERLCALVRRFVGGARTGRVLVVDDDAEYRGSMAATLARAGHAVEQAADGVGALRSMRTHRPDLVLLDMVMIGMDGIEVIQAMHADDALRAIPVVLVTAADLPSSVMEQLYQHAVMTVPKHDGVGEEILGQVRAILARLPAAEAGRDTE